MLATGVKKAIRLAGPPIHTPFTRARRNTKLARERNDGPEPCRHAPRTSGDMLRGSSEAIPEVAVRVLDSRRYTRRPGKRYGFRGRSVE
jgi:hypothetical protein